MTPRRSNPVYKNDSYPQYPQKVWLIIDLYASLASGGSSCLVSVTVIKILQSSKF